VPFSARLTDMHTCPMWDFLKPHVGGPIIPPCSTTVHTNMLPQARATDRAQCASAPDFIVTGSSTVMVNNLMAARITDFTMHGGLIGPVGSLNVIIGGPTAGATLGFPATMSNVFSAVAADRPGGSLTQTEQNCGVESSRQVLWAAGRRMTEQVLLNIAVLQGLAANDTRPNQRGGTSPADRQAILNQFGVPNHQESQTRDNITQAVAEGRGVITSHDAGQLWGQPGFNGSGHAITVTGLQYDSKGQLTNVLTNDSGLGQANRPVPAATYFSSLRSGRNANVTDAPIHP
jgi:uncharacterized Zn-binding protein involved in type VI secretion